MSAQLRAADVAEWTGGVLRQGSPATELGGVSIDTRTLAAGELFVAIAGPNHDAHSFLAKAAAAGAGGLLILRGRPLPAEVKPELPVIEVADTTRALGALAAGHRARFEGPVVAITGSNGKTTTKEMCAAILGWAAPCLKTQGNLNNEFGVPLTLLRRRESDRSIVVEIGMNHRGEIAPLAAIARPSVGVVTNVGSAHIEHLGSREAIALEKGDLLAALPAGGTAVIPARGPLRARGPHARRGRALRPRRGRGRARGAGARARDGRLRLRAGNPRRARRRPRRRARRDHAGERAGRRGRRAGRGRVARGARRGPGALPARARAARARSTWGAASC